VLAALALACDATTAVPEPGAILLRVSVAPGAPTPDELRVFVYDDGGAIWQDMRFPEQGMLAVRAGGSLGTILIQPGSTRGALRVHVTGRAAGAQIDDGVLTVAASERVRGTFDLVLQAAAPVDDDRDGVPDSIDDCVALANPAQGGCPGGDGDGGEDAPGGSGGAGGGGVGGTIGSGGDGGAGGETSNGGSVGAGGRGGDGGAGSGGIGQGGVSGKPGSGGSGNAGVSGTAGGGGRGGVGGSASGGRGGSGSGGRGGTTGSAGTGGTASGGTTGTGGGAGTSGGGRGGTGGTLDQGDACANAGQCRTGFCKDGVCCNTACTDACESCGGGTCQAIRNAEDAPECVAPMHCNGGARCVLN